MSVRVEKRRGFQPPWYKVMIFDCGCGTTTLKMQRGPGAVVCNSGKHLLGFDGKISSAGPEHATQFRCASDEQSAYTRDSAITLASKPTPT